MNRYIVMSINDRLCLRPESVPREQADWDVLERLNGRAVVLASDADDAIEAAAQRIEALKHLPECGCYACNWYDMAAKAVRDRI